MTSYFTESNISYTIFFLQKFRVKRTDLENHKTKWKTYYFDMCTKVLEVEKHKNFSFILQVADRTFKFGCFSEADLNLWIFKMGNAMDEKQKENKI